jgi:hypothetical protein
MIINQGLGDDLSDLVPSPNEPNVQGIYFLLAGLGVYAFFHSVFGNNNSNNRSNQSNRTHSHTSSTKQRETTEYKLEVDITGNGRWVEQATGSKSELSKEATRIKKREGMKTRLVPI